MLYIFCSECDYKTDIQKVINDSETVKEQLEKDGGCYKKDICPNCGEDGSLHLNRPPGLEFYV